MFMKKARDSYSVPAKRGRICNILFQYRWDCLSSSALGLDKL